jgi:hypothetical protein
VRFVLAALAGIYPSHGSTVAAPVAMMATKYTATRPGAYLQLATALIGTDDIRAVELAHDIIAWDHDIPAFGMDAPDIPPAIRAGNILVEGVLAIG